MKIEFQKHIKLISRYKTILNRKNNNTNKISNIKLVQSITKLLKVIII